MQDSFSRAKAVSSTAKARLHETQVSSIYRAKEHCGEVLSPGNATCAGSLTTLHEPLPVAHQSFIGKFKGVGPKPAVTKVFLRATLCPTTSSTLSLASAARLGSVRLAGAALLPRRASTVIPLSLLDGSPSVSPRSCNDQATAGFPSIS